MKQEVTLQDKFTIWKVFDKNGEHLSTTEVPMTPEQAMNHFEFFEKATAVIGVNEKEVVKDSVLSTTDCTISKYIYIQVSQEDENGWLRNFYPCSSREVAEDVFKAIVKRYKEVNKNYAEKIDYDESEEDNFYAYYNPRFNNFHAEIIEEDEKNINKILEELECDGFFI